jgi:hypothetical protein
MEICYCRLPGTVSVFGPLVPLRKRDEKERKIKKERLEGE